MLKKHILALAVVIALLTLFASMAVPLAEAQTFPTQLFLLDDTGNDLIAYDLPNIRQTTHDINDIGSKQWDGVAATHNRFYVLNDTNDAVEVLNHSGTALNDEDIFIGTGSWTGVAVTATRIYTLLGGPSGVIRSWNKNGAWQTSEDIVLTTSRGYYGLTVTSTRIYALNDSDNKVEVWDLAGNRQSSEDVTVTAAASGHYWSGLTVTKTRLYLIENDADDTSYLRVYNHSGSLQSGEGITLPGRITYQGLTIIPNRADIITTPLSVAVKVTPTSVNVGDTVVLDATVDGADPTDELTYRWTSSSGGIFANPLVQDTTWTASGTTPGPVQLTITVTNIYDEIASASVTITVGNHAPVVTAGTSASSVQVGNTVDLTGTATDEDEGDTLSYRWTSNNGGTFADNTRLTTTWTATNTVPGDVTLTLTVTDSYEASSSASVTVTVANNPPNVNIVTLAQTVTVSVSLSLVATATDDNEGDILSYRWTSNNGGTFADDTRLATTWTAPDTSTTVVLTLTVTDAHEGTGMDSVTITVSNRIPTVSADGTPLIVAVSEVVNLDGTATDVDGGDNLTYNWTSSGGGAFADVEALDTTWTAPTSPGIITLTLSATDDAETPATAFVQLTVTVVMPDHPGYSTILGFGVWGGVVEPHDRFIAVSYYADEDPPSEDSLLVGTNKWVITLSTDTGIIAGQVVPSMGPNVAVFYLPPLGDASRVMWEDNLYISISKNPLIFATVETPQRLVPPWRYNADATGNIQADVITDLGQWLQLATSGIEAIIQTAGLGQDYVQSYIGDDATLAFTSNDKITAEGLHWLRQGYRHWLTLTPEIFNTSVNIPEGFTVEANSDIRSQEIRDSGINSEFTVSVLAIASQFGLPSLIVGSVALLALVTATLALFVFLGGGAHHALPFLGMAALVVALVGLLNLTLLAVCTVLMFLVAAAIFIQKYTAG